MNFFEAMTALQNGRQIRMVGWAKDVWVGLRESEFKLCGKVQYKHEILNQAGETWGANTSLNSLIQSKWEEYKEPTEEKKS